MATLQSITGPLNRYSFIWTPTFGVRQHLVYSGENEHFLPATFPPSTTGEIIERFVGMGCGDDIDRYSSRTLLLRTFLEAADIEILRGPPGEEAVSKRMVLLDDRNNETASRLHPEGSCRPSLGLLSAQQLYTELSQQVISLDYCVLKMLTIAALTRNIHRTISAGNLP
jgi:hypothetical protein